MPASRNSVESLTKNYPKLSSNPQASRNQIFKKIWASSMLLRNCLLNTLATLNSHECCCLLILFLLLLLAWSTAERRSRRRKKEGRKERQHFLPRSCHASVEISTRRVGRRRRRARSFLPRSVAAAGGAAAK